MLFYRILRLISAGAGMLALATVTSACAFEEQEACDEPGCLLDGEGEDESLASTEQEWGRSRRPDLAGYRFRSSYDPRVYLIDYDGYRRAIPDDYTYNNLFRDWRDVYIDDRIDRIARGRSFSRGAFLTRSWHDDDNFWLIDGGRRHWLRNRGVMDRYRFGWNNLRRMDRYDIDRFNYGHDWW